MRTQLPTSVAAYFRISSGTNFSELKNCFTDNAVVRDEDQKHQGYNAILDWLTKAKQQYNYKTEILDSKTHRNSIIVQTKVSGNFPGSPVELDHVFQLSGERIASLEIKPCP